MGVVLKEQKGVSRESVVCEGLAEELTDPLLKSNEINACTAHRVAQEMPMQWSMMIDEDWCTALLYPA
jgi:hypothetical protein